MEVVPEAVAMGCIAHDSLVFEAEAFIEMASAGIVFEDIEKEAMSVKFVERHAHEFREDATAETTLWDSDNDALELDGARVFAEAAKDGVGLYLAGFGFADVIARIARGEGGAMAILAPLADEPPGYRGAFDGNDGRDVGECGKAEKHGAVGIVLSQA